MYTERLNYKQQCQFQKLCKEFQPYYSFDEVVFLELLSAAIIYCNKNIRPFCRGKEERFKTLIIDEAANKIKSKYYFDGMNFNKGRLTNRQIEKVCRIKPCVKINAFTWTMSENCKPIQKILFVKLVRACRDFMRAGMSDEAKQPLFEKLNTVLDAMPE